MDDIRRFQLRKIQYKAKIFEIMEDLLNLESDLELAALNLATSYKWKEWHDGIPAGERIQFNWGMLSNTGDKCVDEVLALILQIESVRNELMKNNHITYEDNSD